VPQRRQFVPTLFVSSSFVSFDRRGESPKKNLAFINQLFTNEPIHRARISPEKSNEESQVLTGVKGAEFDSFQSIKFIDNGV
jgi:hypothetical protein